MSEILKRYIGVRVEVASGAGMSGFKTEGMLAEPEGEWFVVNLDSGDRTFVRRDLTFFIMADPPADVKGTLPRSAVGGA